ncbi:MAG: sigma-54 interaction domain-containing protein [Phycisphaerales bacterium]
MAERAARSACTILLTGETGVGKGHVARWLWKTSLRADQPYIPVNCGAIPESLIDSQLFGHVKGAFSGATNEHPGLVRAAEGGTLFLDEVGELPLSAQTRLLRLLQEREIQPVGLSHPVKVDVRIVAATNVDLRAAVEEERFRRDLFYRLDVVRIDVEPLRQRRDEIPVLIETFNTEFAGLYGQPQLEISPEAHAVLAGHPWPGNVRQLRTVLERLHVLAPDDLVTPTLLWEVGQVPSVEASSESPLDRVRREEIERVLGACDGSITKAAKVFGVHRSTLHRWLRESPTDG